MRTAPNLGRALAVTLVAVTAASGCAFITRANESTKGAEQPITPDGGGTAPSPDADGSVVAYQSTANDIVAGDTAYVDVFARDAVTNVTERVSVSTAGVGGTGTSGDPATSATGRYVAFESAASNLVDADTNARTDIFVRDRQGGTTERVNLGPSGVEATGGNSLNPSISGDGRYVAFESSATNLVAGGDNTIDDVFVHDRQTDVTTRVSLSSAGVAGNNSSQSPAISSDGRYVAFESTATNLVTGDTNAREDVFVHDRQTATTTLASVASAGTLGDLASFAAAISSDGRYVAFTSGATNLVGGDVNGAQDVFVRDRQTATTTRVSIADNENEAVLASQDATISGDGRYVSFLSAATNLVAGDTNGQSDAFVRDRTAGTTTRASLVTGGGQSAGAVSGPALSANAAVLAFASTGLDLVGGDINGDADVFAHTRATSVSELVSRRRQEQGSSSATSPSLSGDGRYVAFESYADNLVPGDTGGIDVFVKDLATSGIERINVDSAGGQPSAGAGEVVISADGRYVAFSSGANDLVVGDTNGTTDVFVRDRQTATTTRVSVDSAGVQGNGASGASGIGTLIDLSPDGRYVTFASLASNLATTDTNTVADVFVHDRQSATTTQVSLDLPEVTLFSANDPAISADGRYVAFWTDQSAGDYVLVRDRQTATTSIVSVQPGGAAANGTNRDPDLSNDGRYVAFRSSSTNILPGEAGGYDVFVRDRQSAVTTKASQSTGGVAADAGSTEVAVSGDGRYVVFTTVATNLDVGDTNNNVDVFVRDRTTNTTTRATVNPDGTQANGNSNGPAVTADGRYIAFDTLATNIVTPDANGSLNDVYVRANPIPTVTGVSPATRARGTTGTITVTGTNFLPGAAPLLSGDFVINSFTRLSETTITMSVTVNPDAATGPVHAVFVSLPGSLPGLSGSLGLCAACLTVT